MNKNRMKDLEMLEFAYQQALEGYASGGIPIGAAIFREGRLLGAGHNRRVQDGSQVDHGEINCLRVAGRGSFRGAVMASTLMPCAMCAGAIVQFGLVRVIVGEERTFCGEREFLQSRGVEVTVLDDERCRKLLEDFIRAHPTIWGEDIGT